MKKNDLATIILIISIALIASYFAADAMIGSPQNNPVQVETVNRISGDYPTPDSRVFGGSSIDATVDINGQSGQSNQPFSD